MSAIGVAPAVRRALVGVVAAAGLAGCAGAPPPQALDRETAPNTPAAATLANPLAVYDPLQGFNRRVYRFNALADRYALQPAVAAYHAAVPLLARQSVSNFFANLGEITTFINTLAQAKPKASLVTLSRFVINSTLGVGGLFDPATGMGLAQRNEDLGQTLGVYGLGTGPYLVLPFFGPSDVRDAIGLAGDQAMFFALDPLPIDDNPPARAAYWGAYVLNKRDAVNFRYYQTGSPFEYILVRLVYLNYRALLIQR